MVRSARRVVSESNDKTSPCVSEGVVDLALHKRVALSLPQPDLGQLGADVGHVGGVPQGSPLVDVDHALGRVLGFVEDVVDPVVDAGFVPGAQRIFSLRLVTSVVKYSTYRLQCHRI